MKVEYILLVKNIYLITDKFPKEEIYWLISQIRRCSVSIPSNIAEWSQRSSKKEFVYFLYISKWSATELETQLIISNELWFISKNDFDNINLLLKEILKILSSLVNTSKKQ